MKIVSTAIICILSLCSCSQENVLQSDSELLTLQAQTQRLLDSMPANPENPQDDAGRIHNEILDAYVLNDSLPTTLSEIIDMVEVAASGNNDFLIIRDTAYKKLTVLEAQVIMADSNAALAAAISTSGMTTAAKTILADFCDDFLLLCKTQDDYAIVYDFIIDYEAAIISNMGLTANDKKVLLTTTSIVRHSQYKRRRPKKNTDMDWEMNVFHLVGGIEGSSTSAAKAITTSLSLGLAENQ